MAIAETLKGLQCKVDRGEWSELQSSFIGYSHGHLRCNRYFGCVFYHKVGCYLGQLGHIDYAFLPISEIFYLPLKACSVRLQCVNAL